VAKEKVLVIESQELRSAVEAVRELLENSSLTAAGICGVYDEHFADAAFQTSVFKSRPQFDEATYPPLPLGLLAGLEGEKSTWKTAAELLECVRNDTSPLARLLAAYIWKRGELSRVVHVRSGFVSVRSVGDKDGATPPLEGSVETGDAAVMWQFGRHLANPLTHPICDQHTYRAFVVLETGRLSATSLKRPQVLAYEAWWGRVIRTRLDPHDPTRSAYQLDKLLFSLGKAVLLFPEAYEKAKRTKKPER
jgi:hypothetical protein